jgi:hypothetical protein
MSVENLQRYVYWTPAKQTAHPNNREERLKTIIANIDRQQANVRAAIIEDARSYQQTQRESMTDAEQPTNEDAMDVDPTTVDDEADRPADELLYQNLNAPYVEGSGDPCMLPLAPDGSFFAVPPGLKQARAPQEIQLAKETIDHISLYDKTSRQAPFGRDYYMQALRRTQPYGAASASSGAERRPSMPPPLDRRSSIGSANIASPHSRRSSATPVEGAATRSPPRDPRLARAALHDPRVRSR